MKPLTKLLSTSVLSLTLMSSMDSVYSSENSPGFDFEELQVVTHENIKKKPAINPHDPYEEFNREMLKFNLTFHQMVGKPLVEIYRVIPLPIRNSTDNFFSNLGEPLSFLNSVLQGNIEDSLSTFMRFSINSTFGILGLFDIATEAGLEEKPEDFGQTLYVWGIWTDANYLVLPLLGPSTTRDLFGKVEGAVDPIYTHDGLQYFYGLDDEFETRSQLFIAKSIVKYNNAAPLVEELSNQIDPYIFAREAYRQHRINEIYNGNPPLPDIEDDFLFE